MSGRTDDPGADPDARARPWPPGSPAEGGRAPGSQDELRRRLANLPASHPSSPRYRDGQHDAPSTRAGREGASPESAAARRDEPRAGRSGVSRTSGPGASRGARSEQSRVNRAGQPAEGRDEPAAEMAGGPRGERREPDDRDDAGEGRRASGPREAAGGAAAVAARPIRGGQPRAPEQDAKVRRADDTLWVRAAAQHAAAQARRRAGGTGVPSYPPARREPFRPWFTASGEDELWLNAEGTGDPWFAEGDRENKR